MKIPEILRLLAPGDLTLVEILHKNDILEELEDYENALLLLADELEYMEFVDNDI